MTEQATPQTCSWEEVGEAWETTCGHSFMLNDGTPRTKAPMGADVRA